MWHETPKYIWYGPTISLNKFSFDVDLIEIYLIGRST